ncbi:MAG TPA: SPOR domain-containing protein [Thermodesulfobacteriota bacterium]|nr:SPOR domain-containing protein [Thermodesulfobacteriota bacterium]
MSETKSPTNRQIIFLFLGFLVLFILVFSLGVIVGKGLGDPEIKVAKKQTAAQAPVKEEPEIENMQDAQNDQEISQQEMKDILEEAKTDIPKDSEQIKESDTIQIETTDSEKKIAMNAQSEVNLKVEKPVLPKKENTSLLTKNTPLPPIVAGGQYTIQIGSFKNESDAKSLQNKLKSRGYPAFLKQVTIGEDTWFRLRIGTFETKDQAKIYGDILLKKEPELVKSVYATLNA